jgi:hypothetical protein
MVKRREPKASSAVSDQTQPTKEQIEAFASAADGGQNIHAKTPDPDQNAIRDFKAMRVPFNQYEYEQLEAASKLSGRSKLNFMRHAMLKFAKEILDEV